MSGGVSGGVSGGLHDWASLGSIVGDISDDCRVGGIEVWGGFRPEYLGVVAPDDLCGIGRDDWRVSGLDGWGGGFGREGWDCVGRD